MMVNVNLIKSLFGYLKDNQLLPSEASVDLFMDEDEECSFIAEQEQITLPYYINYENDELLQKVILHKYNVDIFNHLKSLDENLNCLLFSFLHEVGHYHQYLLLGEELDDMDERLEITRTYENEFEKELAYRSLGSEAYADTFAINVLNKHKEDLVNLVNSVTEVFELTPYGLFALLD